MSSSIRRAAPLVLPAATGKHSATVIFIHGLGDSGAGWTDGVQHMKRYRRRLDHVKFILPHAPVIPITMVGLYLAPIALLRTQMTGGYENYEN